MQWWVGGRCGEWKLWGEWKYGVWGEDDCGTVYFAKPLLKNGEKEPLAGVRLNVASGDCRRLR